MISVRVQRDDFDEADIVGPLVEGRSDVGALVTFTGLCRDEDGRLAALQLEHYPGMAEAEIARVVEIARARWPLTGIGVVHRYGRIAVGEKIVIVATASAHRRAAFEAAEFLMDYLKTHAPFWKKEHLADGTSGEWIAADESDDDAARRWERPNAAE